MSDASGPGLGLVAAAHLWPCAGAAARRARRGRGAGRRPTSPSAWSSSPSPCCSARSSTRWAAAAPAFGLIGLWAVLGIGGIAAGVAVALLADRLAHRRRAAALAAAFERAITLPLSYHARAGSGRVVRTMLSGTDALFMIWLSFFREHLSALVGIAFLVPTALFMNVQLAGLLAALAVVYVVRQPRRRAPHPGRPGRGRAPPPGRVRPRRRRDRQRHRGPELRPPRRRGLRSSRA